MPPRPNGTARMSAEDVYTIARARPVSNVLLYSVLPVASWFVVRSLINPAVPLPALYVSLGLSLFAAGAVVWLIPRLGERFVKANLKGIDLLKEDKSIAVPESMGLICAAVYILLLLLFIPFLFSDFLTSKVRVASLEGLAATSGDFPHQQLAVYLSAVLSLLIATLLGFLDDLFDIRWRHKLPIPVLASIPLLMVYYAESGNTHVVVPIPFRSIFGTVVNLGPLYYIYMSLLSTFATNSINILAGVNGVEVSQAVIIAISVILNDMLYLPWSFKLSIQYHLPVFATPQHLSVGGVYAAGLAHGSKELVDRHLLSSYFMLPLLGVCLGFLYHNWYPARVFPGDTLCYVCGMAFAVVGILGHFSKTLLLFFIPQIFNFLLSCPQLFGFVPCPRHRVPRPDYSTNLLHPSEVQFEKPLSTLGSLFLRILSILRLVRLKTDARTRQIQSSTNLTILNTILVLFGPMSEKRLTQVLMLVQVAGSMSAFTIRYGLAGLVYDGDRR